MDTYNFDVVYDRSATNSVKYDLRKLIFGREEVIPMWVADMDFATPDFILDAIRKRLQHPILGYAFRGNEFAEPFVQWMYQSHGFVIDHQSVCFSPGIVPALVFCLLAYSNEDDGVVVQTPVYHPFFQVVEQNNRRVINNPLKFENGRYCIDFIDLEKKTVGAKMLFLSNPHNPVGRCWTRDELRRLSEICLRNDVLIVSDEIHSDLMLNGHKHIPLASLSDQIAAITIACYAPSKTFNMAGMSTSAVVIADETLRKKFNDVVERLHIGMGNIAGTAAFIAAYTSGRPWLMQVLRYIELNLDFLKGYLTENIPQVKLIEPEATYMAWLDFSELGLDSKNLNELLINEAGVGFNDGAMFGEGGALHQRINLACPRETLIAALSNIKKAIQNQSI